MKKVLIVEDHDNLRASISALFSDEGFLPTVAATLREADVQMKFEPDVVVLDWMLPDGQGIDFLKRLRVEHPKLPVILLTARVDVFDKVLGLELGANDYMTKPFEPRELIARVRARLRDVAPEASHIVTSPSEVYSIGSLKIDALKRKVEFRGSDIEMVKKEFDLLSFFAQHPDTVFSRDEILNKVWGYDVFPTTRTVDMHVMLIRQKLDEALIQTVRAVGYKFSAQ